MIPGESHPQRCPPSPHFLVAVLLACICLPSRFPASFVFRRLLHRLEGENALLVA